MFFQSVSNVVLDNVDVSRNDADGSGGGISATRCRIFFMQRSQAGPRSPLSSNLNGTAMSPAALRSTGLFSEAAPMSVVDI